MRSGVLNKHKTRQGQAGPGQLSTEARFRPVHDLLHSKTYLRHLGEARNLGALPAAVGIFLNYATRNGDLGAGCQSVPERLRTVSIPFLQGKLCHSSTTTTTTTDQCYEECFFFFPLSLSVDLCVFFVCSICWRVFFFPSLRKDHRRFCLSLVLHYIEEVAEQWRGEWRITGHPYLPFSDRCVMESRKATGGCEK